MAPHTVHIHKAFHLSFPSRLRAGPQPAHPC
jgi:hypothetical protein